MKINMSIECTPEEARAFFGLPDAEAVNAMVMNAWQGSWNQALNATDPSGAMASLYAPWTQAHQSFQNMQRLFLDQMQASWGGLLPAPTTRKTA